MPIAAKIASECQIAVEVTAAAFLIPYSAVIFCTSNDSICSSWTFSVWRKFKRAYPANIFMDIIFKYHNVGFCNNNRDTPLLEKEKYKKCQRYIRILKH